MPAILRLSIVYWAGWYHLIGPITRSTIYSTQDKARMLLVRDRLLSAGIPWHLLDPPDANSVEVLRDDLEWEPFEFGMPLEFV